MRPMKTVLAAAAAAVTVAGCAGGGSAAFRTDIQAPEAVQSARMQGMIREVMRESRIEGMSAVAVSGGTRVLAAGYGLADRARKTPVTVDTVFPLGSITKLFTATAVMQLVEQGRVDLDAPVSVYLPELAGYGAACGPASAPTIRQFLTHHGGLPGNIMEGFELRQPDTAAFPRLPGLVAREPAPFPPDTVFAYSNTGYGLLGCVVERMSTSGYLTAVREGILRPLGMEHTRFLYSPADAEGVARGYEGSTETAVYPIRDMPAGALMASAGDMERFMGFIFDQGRPGVLGRDAFSRMITRQNGHVLLDGDFPIGLGYWLIRPFPAAETFASHGGELPPFHALLVTIPERRIGVFLAANSSGAASALIPLGIRMARSLYEDQTGTAAAEAPVPPRTALPAADTVTLEGAYASPMGLIRVRAQGGGLRADGFGLPLSLVHREDDTWTAELSVLGLVSIPLAPLAPLRFTFVKNGGEVYLRMSSQGFFGGAARRITPGKAPQAWQARAGSYEIQERDGRVVHRWPQKVALVLDRSCGMLFLSYTFVGTTLTLPLEFPPGAGNAAIIAGVGAGLGERITAREEGGQLMLAWSGMVLKRKG